VSGFDVAPELLERLADLLAPRIADELAARLGGPPTTNGGGLGTAGLVTLDELVESIGVDAVRYFMLQRSHDTMVDLDLDLARQQSSDNPVYYVQYAHARIASILAKAGEERVERALAEAASFSGPLDPSERTLIKKLLAFGEEVDEAAARRAPHRITAYVLELAQTFTAFYRDCQVLGAEGEGVESLRLALGVAAQRTIARALDLLGVDAPQTM